MRKDTTAKYVAVAAGALVALAAYRLRSHRLAGRVVLLTGGSRGLGLQLARELAKEGCKLVLVARSEEELAIAKHELQAKGADAEIIPCDLTSPTQIAEMLKAAMAINGRIDIVINDAGRIDVAPVDSLEEGDFQAAMDLMFWAPVRIVLGLLPSLLQSGDSDIVNISSIGGKVAVPHLLPYCSAKFALCGFSEGLDTELRARGVRVLTVTPGLLRTGSHKKALFGGDTEAEYRWFALGATVPGISMEVERAACQIVSALKGRRRTLTLSWSAQVARRMYGAFPELSMRAMGYMNAFLPSANRNRISQRGEELAGRQPSIFQAITNAGESAAATQNENLPSNI